MANTIQLRNSVVKDKAPLPSELVIGEVCVGAHPDSPMLLFKDSSDNIIKIEPGSGVTPARVGLQTVKSPNGVETAWTLFRNTPRTRRRVSWAAQQAPPVDGAL